MSPSRHWPSTLVLLLGALALGWVLAHQGLAPDDEMIALANGRRIAGGQVLYRDFFDFTAPLPNWLAAGSYLLFGPRVLAARLVQLALLLAATWQCHRLARWLGMGPWQALLPAWLPIFAFYQYMPGFSHHWVVLPFVLAALLAALAAAEGERPRGWALAGGWAGLAVAALQTDGTVVTTAVVGYLLVRAWLGREAWAPRLGAFAAGWLATLGLVVAILALTGALGSAYADVFRWPLSHYRTAGGINSIRYLTDFAGAVGPMAATRLAVPAWYLRLYTYLAVVLVPPLMALGALLWGLGVLAGRRALPTLAARRGLVALAAIGFALVGTSGRADVYHLAYVAMPAFLLAAALGADGLARARDEWRGVALLPALAFALLLAGGLANTMAVLSFQPHYLAGRGPDARAAEDATLAYMRAHARPGDRQVAVPSGGYYYFYGPPPAVHLTTVFSPAARYYDPEELAAFWREVAASGARFLVVDPSSEPFMRDAFPGPPPGYVLVNEAPSTRYIGPWVRVFERRSQSAQANSASAASAELASPSRQRGGS